MKRRTISHMHNEQVNVTPLIDVVMCLIIFFLLVGHIAKQVSAQNVKVPIAKNGNELEDRSGQVIINVVPQKGPTPDYQPPPEIIVFGKQVSIDELADELNDYKSNNPDLTLIIRADQSIQYKYISPILISCAKAGIDTVNFAIQNPSQ
ncbi:MAG TPA: biopolymer transporter ExbD [Phycisphaerae bacterium]|nr:biopolymer transporter ExbD [Phycisphaerae bacterium]